MTRQIDLIKTFPASYQEEFTAEQALKDIEYLKSLDAKPIAMAFFDSPKREQNLLHFKVYFSENSLILSNIVPIFEHLGFCVIGERPHCIILDKKTYWIHHFTLSPENCTLDSLDSVKEIFYEAFYEAWTGRAENDDLNRLVLGAGITWREISMLRAYSRYLRQVGFTYSQSYIEQALFGHPEIAKKLVELFVQRFSGKNTESVQASIESSLEHVSSLDQDRILRRFLSVILGTLRTNFFQKTPDGQFKPYLSFKLDSHAIPDLPLPLPLYEVFVYSPRMEGIHLRNAKVARGGIRWSDRFEDYRTEVLGLVKAQQVKNAVIVPLGAKGGFICKQLPKTQNREEILKEGVACYQYFIQGLLDLTDNLKEGKVIPPEHVVRYDQDDVYLVVAADKGTATFSDIANQISIERQFWLGDAFASGGSVGYDHKKMGITARGAWESVKRHFRERGCDIQAENFTVVGIGDMSGDVFGNGLLLSPHIQLVAAFNHIHIFIDPNPLTEVSYKERQRLFELPRSNWTDYNAASISSGGGVFLRSAKSIPISNEMKQRFGIQKDKMEPNELIQTLLKAEVDLLWNGGIGTYVKSYSESHLEVGDKNNDLLRVNGEDLRCKVVGEGGNLGFTQRGRVEYALKGGRINTDAIDNSAGVDCSDHEVNIKILLNAAMVAGKLNEKQRNLLLAEMTEEVSQLVLQHNKDQTAALSLASCNAHEYISMHARLIHFLEESGRLNRKIEFLPSDDELAQRKQKQQGLTRPELSVLLAYTKIFLKEQLLASTLPEEPYIAQNIGKAFPQVLSKKYPTEMQHHRLHREIIITLLINGMIDEVGLTFLQRLQDETGAESPEIVRAYVIVREVFEVSNLRNTIHELGNTVSADVKIKMLQELNRLLRRGTRWFLRHRRLQMNIETEIKAFKVGVRYVVDIAPQALRGAVHRAMLKLSKELHEVGVPDKLAIRVGSMGSMFSALDIVDAAAIRNFSLDRMAYMYYAIGSRLDLGWLREQIKGHPVHNNWDALARAAFRDDLDSTQREVTVSILNMESTIEEVEARIDAWIEKQALMIQRWRQMISALKESPDDSDFTRFAVTLRELKELVN